MKPRVMVTGAAGFIGGNLCRRLLEEGYDVVGIDNLSAGTLANLPAGIDFYEEDIRDKSIFPLFKKAEAVFHLAAKNCLWDCLTNPPETGDINVRGTINVLEASKNAAVRKFIYADSSAVYEGVYEFPSKVHKVNPLGAYAVSKHSGALFAKMYKNMFGLNVTRLRYFNVYGPAQDYRRVIPPVISGFILKTLNGERPLIYGTGEKRRDFVYVDDVNDFHLLALKDARTDGRVFNLGTGINYSVNEIFNLVAKALNVKRKPIYLEDLPGEAYATLADVSRERQLGWRPRTDIKTGINYSIAYLKKEMETGRDETPTAMT